MDELSAARRVLARMGPEAFLGALEEADRQALHGALREPLLLAIVASPRVFAESLTQTQRHVVLNHLRRAIEEGCEEDSCRARAGRNRQYCDEHTAAARIRTEARRREIEAAMPRRSLIPGPNGCCYRNGGVACPNTGTENVGGVAACDAHARQLPGAAERRSMRPYT